MSSKEAPKSKSNSNKVQEQKSVLIIKGRDLFGGSGFDGVCMVHHGIIPSHSDSQEKWDLPRGWSPGDRKIFLKACQQLGHIPPHFSPSSEPHCFEKDTKTLQPEIVGQKQKLLLTGSSFVAVSIEPERPRSLFRHRRPALSNPFRLRHQDVSRPYGAWTEVFSPRCHLSLFQLLLQLLKLVVTSASLLVTSALLVVTMFAIRNKRPKKKACWSGFFPALHDPDWPARDPLARFDVLKQTPHQFQPHPTSASLVVTGALLLATRSY